jgi:hypothetical protein
VRRTGRLRRLTPLRKSSSRGLTHTALHKLWREALIRERGKRCEAEGMGGMACTNVIQAHHIYGKETWPRLRYDLENGALCCSAHHGFWVHRAPANEVAPWLVRICGHERLDRLSLKAMASKGTKSKMDLVAEKLRLQQLLA